MYLLKENPKESQTVTGSMGCYTHIGLSVNYQVSLEWVTMVLSLIFLCHLVKVAWMVQHRTFKKVTQWSFEFTLKKSEFWK